MERPARGEAEASQTLDRGLQLLEAVAAAAPAGRTVTELGVELGLSRTVVYRLVATLQRRGYVRRGAESRVRLGFGVVHLARQVNPLLREATLPALRQLAEDVGATAHLTVMEGGEALAVAVVEPSWTDFHVAYREGARHPLGSGAAGRAILAGRDVATGRDASPGEAAYHLSHGELQAGAQGIATAVLGVPGLEASVGVVALGELDPAVVGPRVVTAARAVAAALQRQ